MSEDRCICCGDIVPEGRMVCPNCEKQKPMKNLSHGEMVQIAEERRKPMTKHDAIKHLSYKISYCKGGDRMWVDGVNVDALEIAVRAMAEDAEEISYADCSNAVLKMWMDNVLTDGEYNRIMDKLNEREKHNGQTN